MATKIQKPEARIRKAEVCEYPALAALWRRSVQATHDFLDPADLEQIYRQMTGVYLPGVREVWLSETDSDAGWRTGGFMGCNGAQIEMLFVEPELFGQGLGSALLRHAPRPLRHCDPGRHRAEQPRPGFLSAPRLCDHRPFPAGHGRQALPLAAFGVAGMKVGTVNVGSDA